MTGDTLDTKVKYDAEVFLSFSKVNSKKETLKFYSALNEESRKYIRETKPYSVIYESSRRVF